VFEVTEDEPNYIKVAVPADPTSRSRQVSDAKMQYKFKFGKVFDEQSKQEEVFDEVGKDICDGFLGGFNATVFAYGQTGSGKTYTIEGSSKQYDDRGLLPRCISYVFDQLSERKAEDIRIEVTYLEIYNDSAYDLLNAASGGNARLPKVTVQDNGKQCTIRDLTVHPATTEETATNLLFVGKTNRTVAKTSMNLQSSRSHSIFTIYMTCRKPDSDTIVRSKLNLVDLAGSERIGNRAPRASS